MRRVLLLAPLLVASSACKKDDEPAKALLERFNDRGDVVTVEVTPKGSDPGEALIAEVHSSTGERIIGTIVVDPGSGPIGTVHRVTVDVDVDFAEQVDKVEFEADAGDRGAYAIEMEQDSADLGLWVEDITSYGAEGEERVDTFTFALWHLEEDPLPEDAEAEE